MIRTPVVSEQASRRSRLLAIALFAAAASLRMPAEAAAAPLTCNWGYYAGGSGNFIALLSDTDMTSPNALRLGRFFKSSSTLSATGSIDFNNDNKTDVFRLAPRDATTAQWQNSPGGKSAWIDMAYAGQSLNELRFGDMNADGYTDLLADVYDAPMYHWYVSSAGISSYVEINSSNDSYRVETGQFNAGADADVFYTKLENQSGNWTNRWEMSSAGTAAPVNLAYADIDPEDLRFGDFDGDGITDVFAAIPVGNGKFQWAYSSAGTASFQNLALTPYAVSELNFGDFNGDKVTDVFVAADNPDGSLRWEYWPSGILPPVVLETSMPTMPYVGDFDGDGIADAFLAECSASAPFVRAPSPRKLVPKDANIYQVNLADVDGDGDDDLIFHSTCQPGPSSTCTSHNNVTAVTRSNGDGTFEPLSSQVLDTTIDWRYWRMLTGDFDGNGHAALLFVDIFGPAGSSRVAMAKWNGSQFALSSPVSLGTGLQASNPYVGDFDGDGRSDVLWSSVCTIGNGLDWQSCSVGDTNDLTVVFSTGAGFARASDQTVGATGWDDYEELVGDVNGDGKDDVIWNSTCQTSAFPNHCDIGDTNYIRVGLSDGTGQFTVGNLQNFGPGWSKFNWPFTGDFNGDGRADIAWYQPCTSTFCPTSQNLLRIALATAAGNYLVLTDASFGARDWSRYTLQTGDVNGDGSDDLIWFSTSPANDLWPTEILVALSNGDGTFQLTPIEQLKGTLRPDLARWMPGDVNADGKVDFVASDVSDANVEVFLSGGPITSYCGNGKVENQETCDDGDSTWARGQHCNATCHLLACGDTDDSGSITVSDALFTLRAGIGLKPCDACVCDVDHNGSTGVSDALRVLRKAVGLSVVLSCAACS